MPVEKTGALKALGTVVHTAYDGYVTESTFAVDASKPPLCWRTQVAGKGLSGECKGESCISLATAKGQLDAYASGTGVSGDVAGILKALTAAGLGDPDAIREAERKARARENEKRRKSDRKGWLEKRAAAQRRLRAGREARYNLDLRLLRDCERRWIEGRGKQSDGEKMRLGRVGQVSEWRKSGFLHQRGRIMFQLQRAQVIANPMADKHAAKEQGCNLLSNGV